MDLWLFVGQIWIWHWILEGAKKEFGGLGATVLGHIEPKKCTNNLYSVKIDLLIHFFSFMYTSKVAQKL